MRERKPAECLAFAGLKPGESVIELAPGKGYYTRLLSAATGPGGKLLVIASPKRPDAPADAPAPSAPIHALAADAHYKNITVSEQRALELSLPADSADLVWTSLNYHDFHNVKDLDVVKLDREVLKALKPGGVYLVIDHAAEAGSGFRDTEHPAPRRRRGGEEGGRVGGLQVRGRERGRCATRRMRTPPRCSTPRSRATPTSSS